MNNIEKNEAGDLEQLRENAFKEAHDADENYKSLNNGSTGLELERGIDLDENAAIDFLRDGENALAALRDYSKALTAEVDNKIKILERKMYEVRDRFAHGK